MNIDIYKNHPLDKMADSKQNQGYQCELIGSVPDNLFCYKCKLVARKLNLTSCCGESYCHDCIANAQQGNACPACGEQDFNLLVLPKYTRQIEGIQVYCTMKEKGCGWTGLLRQLEEHLDPDKEGCQFVDIKCPFNCLLAVPKNELQHHMAQLCNKREHFCQYCGLKATYEEVVNIHLPECQYVPLKCPNSCGVTCEREDMEDHLKMCRLEEVACRFSGVGCEDRFPRENEEEHIHQKSQSHLSITAATLVTVNQQLQYRVQKQQEKIKDLEKKLQDQDWKIQNQDQKIQDQDQKIQDQDLKLKDQDQRLQDQSQKLRDHEIKLQYQEHKLQDYMKELQEQVETFDKRLKLMQEPKKTQDCVAQTVFTNNFSRQKEGNDSPSDWKSQHKFSMEHFSKEIEKDKPGDWKSPHMYTHINGYKFSIGIDANGRRSCKGKGVHIYFIAMPGEHDYMLDWPAKAKLTLELVNQHGGDDLKEELKLSWEKPHEPSYISPFKRITIRGWYAFIEHPKLEEYMQNDALHFTILIKKAKGFLFL